jgi:hypothetical protein
MTRRSRRTLEADDAAEQAESADPLAPPPVRDTQQTACARHSPGAQQRDDESGRISWASRRGMG